MRLKDYGKAIQKFTDFLGIKKHPIPNGQHPLQNGRKLIIKDPLPTNTNVLLLIAIGYNKLKLINKALYFITQAIKLDSKFE